MSFDIALEEELPREAYFKVGKSINSTVLKKELIEYSADQNYLTVRQQPVIVRFLVSGEPLLNGYESFFSLRLKTNTFTSLLSDGITAIIKKVVIKLPSNSNQILEEIDNYNVLASMIHNVRFDESRLESNWQAGLNSLIDHNRPQGQRRARRFLNLNEGGYRTFVFQLNLSSILFHPQFIPLSLLNGILIELQLATAAKETNFFSKYASPLFHT